MSYSAWITQTARKEFVIQAGLEAVSKYRDDLIISSDEGDLTAIAAAVGRRVDIDHP
jgi:hypothetical protein